MTPVTLMLSRYYNFTKEMIQNANSTRQQPARYKQMKVKIFAVFFAFVGIGLYLADIYTDLSLAVNYFYSGHIKFFYLTLFFVLFSAIVSSVFSLHLYLTDDKDEKLKVSKKIWTIRAIFLICGVAPILRNVDSLYFAWKSYRSESNVMKELYARRMIFEITDGSFLRLFEAFLESGPQLVLQIYIFMEMQDLSPNIFTETEIQQCYTMLMSVISISSSIVAYSNSLRNSLDDKNELKWYLLALLFLWRFFEIIARVIAMGLGISATPYFYLAFFTHFIVVTIWIYFMKTDFCDNWCSEKLYNVLLGVILTFVFFNPEDSPTMKRCLLFYLAMFAENTFLVAYWLNKYSCSSDLSLQLPAVAIQVSSFCLSILIMVIYYKFFHPTVGKFYKKGLRKSNKLNVASETGMEITDTEEMLNMTGNGKTTENIVQNRKGNTRLGVIEKDETTENQDCISRY